jgi:hypothetical protein
MKYDIIVLGVDRADMLVLLEHRNWVLKWVKKRKLRWCLLKLGLYPNKSIIEISSGFNYLNMLLIMD